MGYTWRGERRHKREDIYGKGRDMKGNIYGKEICIERVGDHTEKGYKQEKIYTKRGYKRRGERRHTERGHTRTGDYMES